MRVLVQLLDGQRGGGQRVAADVAAVLCARGHELGVVLPQRGPAVEPFERTGATIHELDLASPRHIRTIVGMASLLRRYDLLYSHTSAPSEVTGSLAARLARRPQVVHRHSYVDLPPGSVPRLAYRAALRGRLIVAVAEHARAELLALGISPEAVLVVPNGTAIAPDPPPPPSEERLRIGLLGRLDAQKGADVLIGAARLARIEPTPVWTVAGGPGPDAGYERQLRAAAAVVGVEMPGAADPAIDYLASLDVVVVPSRRYEGQPLVVLEALALGRPIVASDLAGLREILGDGAGILVPPEDPPALARALESLAADPRLRARLAQRGRALAQERYDVRSTAARAADVVEAVNGKGRGKRRRSLRRRAAR